MDSGEFLLVSLSTQKPFICNITVNARGIPLARLDKTSSNAGTAAYTHTDAHTTEHLHTQVCTNTHALSGYSGLKKDENMLKCF